ncbi:hypothetical protein Drorol1_Dr00017069 [Drosera rotundifolia]
MNTSYSTPRNSNCTISKLMNTKAGRVKLKNQKRNRASFLIKFTSAAGPLEGDLFQTVSLIPLRSRFKAMAFPESLQLIKEEVIGFARYISRIIPNLQILKKKKPIIHPALMASSATPFSSTTTSNPFLFVTLTLHFHRVSHPTTGNNMNQNRNPRIP